MFNLGKPATHTVGGKTYTFSRLERHIVEDWRDWIREQIGDPFAAVERLLDKLPPDTAKEMVKEAQAIQAQLESFSLGCPLAKRFLGNELGLGQLAYLMLRGKHPDITPDEAFAVAMQLGLSAMAKTVQKTSGEAPGKKPDAPAA